jgi:hypothetical protein
VAGDKDAVEACLSRAVCAGKIGLGEARRRIAESVMTFFFRFP